MSTLPIRTDRQTLLKNLKENPIDGGWDVVVSYDLEALNDSLRAAQREVKPYERSCVVTDSLLGVDLAFRFALAHPVLSFVMSNGVAYAQIEFKLAQCRYTTTPRRSEMETNDNVPESYAVSDGVFSLICTVPQTSIEGSVFHDLGNDSNRRAAIASVFPNITADQEAKDYLTFYPEKEIKSIDALVVLEFLNSAPSTWSVSTKSDKSFTADDAHFADYASHKLREHMMSISGSLRVMWSDRGYFFPKDSYHGYTTGIHPLLFIITGMQHSTGSIVHLWIQTDRGLIQSSPFPLSQNRDKMSLCLVPNDASITILFSKSLISQILRSSLEPVVHSAMDFKGNATTFTVPEDPRTCQVDFSCSNPAYPAFKDTLKAFVTGDEVMTLKQGDKTFELAKDKQWKGIYHWGQNYVIESSGTFMFRASPDLRFDLPRMSIMIFCDLLEANMFNDLKFGRGHLDDINMPGDLIVFGNKKPQPQTKDTAVKELEKLKPLKGDAFKPEGHPIYESILGFKYETRKTPPPQSFFNPFFENEELLLLFLLTLSSGEYQIIHELASKFKITLPPSTEAVYDTTSQIANSWDPRLVAGAYLITAPEDVFGVSTLFIDTIATPYRVFVNNALADSVTRMESGCHLIFTYNSKDTDSQPLTCALIFDFPLEDLERPISFNGTISVGDECEIFSGFQIRSDDYDDLVPVPGEDRWGIVTYMACTHALMPLVVHVCLFADAYVNNQNLTLDNLSTIAYKLREFFNLWETYGTPSLDDAEEQSESEGSRS